MFRYPEKMNVQIINALDQFVGQVGSKPQILSDYRPNDPRQHGIGNAVDTVWNGVDPLGVWNKALASQLFSGLGIYINEKNIVSFHFDVRPDRHPSNPAIWGDKIAYVYDPILKDHVRRDEYTTASTIIDILKKNSLIAIAAILLFAGYMIIRR